MQNMRFVVDFHCHLLPSLDDGSRDVEMSLAMLDDMAAQGIGAVVATPHFYPDRADLSAFLDHRDRAVERLGTVYDGARHPRVYLGAEVAYFRGISRSEQLKRLCVVGTKCLLVEMPFVRWTKDMIDDVVNIEAELGLNPILAHIERYINRQKGSTVPYLIDNGALIQSNASFFLDKKTKKQAISMLKREEIHILGSDGHNMDDRRPQLGAALREIEAAGLSARLDGICDLCGTLLEGAAPVF